MRALIIHRDLLPALTSLSDADLGQLIRSASSLVTDERDEAPENPALSFAWITIRTKILEQGQRYEEECRRRSDHAKKAIAARYEKTSPFQKRARA